MFTRYGSLRIIYYSIGALLIICAGVITYFYPDSMIPVLIAIFALTFLDAFVLSRIALKKFNKEVVSCLYDCNVREYMDKLDKRMANARPSKMKSAYADYSALGYEILGDYDSVYDCCQQITADMHKPDYYRFMFSFYLNKELLDQAEKTICDLRAYRTNCKNQRLQNLCDQFLLEMEYSLNLRKGILDGVEEYYASKLEDENIKKVRLSKVSYSYGYGKVLMLKGERERAKDYLKYAAENGGDTKFTALAGRLLTEL